MDRWAGDEDTPSKLAMSGRVARLGIGGFVKGQAMGKADPQSIGRVEVVQSKKEQKAQAQAGRLSAAAQGPSPPAPGAFAGPSWAGAPPVAAALSVHKDGHVIQDISLSKNATLFGRNVNVADGGVILDHASISRQHAAIAFHSTSKNFMLLDLGSAHGTYLKGHRVFKDKPIAIQDGDEIRFGASTRSYVYHAPHHKRSMGDAGREPKRSRVSFADGSQDMEGDKSKLEQVIGYSDGKHFSAQVGPKSMEGEKGQFADLVNSQVLPVKESSKELLEEGQALKSAAVTETETIRDDVKPKVAVSERKLNSSASLYNALPPPNKR